MKCQGVNDLMRACENEARYIDEHGQFMCGICPIKYGADSLRFEDVGKLIAWARNVLDGGTMGGSTFRELRALIGAKRPEPPASIDEPLPGQPLPCGNPCGDSDHNICEREHGHEGLHCARMWNAQLHDEEVIEWT